MKVGSEREVASRQRRPNSGVGEIGVNDMEFCPRGLSKIGPVIREFTLKQNPTGRRDFLAEIGVNDMGFRPRGPF